MTNRRGFFGMVAGLLAWRPKPTKTTLSSYVGDTITIRKPPRFTGLNASIISQESLKALQRQLNHASSISAEAFVLSGDKWFGPFPLRSSIHRTRRRYPAGPRRGRRRLRRVGRLAMSTRIPTSKKRALIAFTLPEGQTVVREDNGTPSADLRRAIKAARAAFWRAYRKPKD